MKHSKFVLTLVLLIAIFIPCISYANPSDIAVTYNGEVIKFEKSPVMVDNSVYVPLRGVFEALGAEVSWNQGLKEVKIVSKDKVIVLKIDSKNAFVNNKLETLEAAPFLYENSTTMVPLRFVSEALDTKVEWEQESKTVKITKEKKEPDKEILTYEEATKIGVAKSNEYISSKMNAKKALIANEDFILSNLQYSLASLQAKQDLKLMDKWSEMQVLITADRVSNNVINAMDELSILLEEKKVSESKIDFYEYKLRMDKLKFDNGMLSSFELENTKSLLSSEKQKIIGFDKKIDLAYLKINNMLERNDSDKYEFEYSMDYAPVGEIDLDSKIRKDASEDPYLWYAQQNLESKEFKLVTYEYNSGGQSWTFTDMDVTKAKLDLDETKKAYEKTIKERHNNLLQLEDSIKTLEISLEQAQKNTNILSVQFVSGKVTKAQVEEAQQNVANLELEIKKLKQQHCQLKVLFEKPYLAPEYFSVTG